MNGADYFLEKMIFENPLAVCPHLNKKEAPLFYSLRSQHCPKIKSDFRQAADFRQLLKIILHLELNIFLSSIFGYSELFSDVLECIVFSNVYFCTINKKLVNVCDSSWHSNSLLDSKGPESREFEPSAAE